MPLATPDISKMSNYRFSQGKVKKVFYEPLSSNSGELSCRNDLLFSPLAMMKILVDEIFHLFFEDIRNSLYFENSLFSSNESVQVCLTKIYEFKKDVIQKDKLCIFIFSAVYCSVLQPSTTLALEIYLFSEIFK